VSSTNRTPDEPGRGSVATGQQAVESKGGNGTAAPTTPAGTGGATGSGNGNGRPAETPPIQRGAPSAVPAESEKADTTPVTGSEIVAAEADGTAKGGSRPSEAAPVAPDEATTARFRLPSPADTARSTKPEVPHPGPKPDAAHAGSGQPNGAPTGAQPVGEAGRPAAAGVAAKPASGPGTSAGTGADRTDSGSAPAPVPTLDPLPAPAVPAPGPAAAQPPPWRRVPGQDAGRPDAAAPVSSSATDRLLDEGPTAFLEAPRYAPQGTGTTSGESAVSETGGWARAARSRPPRQAALQLKRLDPWSVLKLALVLAVVLFFIWLVAVGVLYGVLDGMGVWDRLNGTYADLVSGEAQTGNTLISAGRVFGLAAVVGAINSLLFAVAVTVGAFVYNVSADLVGGIEVTLSERD
jgi:Transmembrane domain of unknown function (DUF3566)